MQIQEKEKEKKRNKCKNLITHTLLPLWCFGDVSVVGAPSSSLSMSKCLDEELTTVLKFSCVSTGSDRSAFESFEDELVSCSVVGEEQIG